jgi:hypothetical protein
LHGATPFRITLQIFQALTPALEIQIATYILSTTLFLFSGGRGNKPEFFSDCQRQTDIFAHKKYEKYPFSGLNAALARLLLRRFQIFN